MRFTATAQRLVDRFGTAITLTRETPGTPAADTPWIPAAPVLDVYALDAVVKGTSAEYVDGTTVIASDLMVVALPRAIHTFSDGEEADGAIVDLVPRMSDTLQLAGAEKVIKKIVPVPSFGPAALFRIFVAS